MSEIFRNEQGFARELDERDPLRYLRERFLFPVTPTGEPLYFVGNSLGLQPRKARAYVEEELTDWERLACEAHFHARHPWYPYHEFLTEPMARVVGAEPAEVVVMNSLTVNLHLMLISFYRPTADRFKIVIEEGAFPSDQYAVASQARFHGFDPSLAIVRAAPTTDGVLEVLEREGRTVALVLLGQVNYLTGLAFDAPAIARAAHAKGCRFGLDLAHGAGNLLLHLHDWEIDFAVWCGYKYLNSGPGALAGCFVHERYGRDRSLPRLEGWWGHDKQHRFRMARDFDPIPGAEGWQLSNPPIFPMAAMRASLEIFQEAGMDRIRAKSERLTGFLEFLLDGLPGRPFCLVTPRNPQARGAQLSLQYAGDARSLVDRLTRRGVFCDFREPDVIRVAPVALYNRFEDVFRLGQLLREHAHG